jgi:hypothetical protein
MIIASTLYFIEGTHSILEKEKPPVHLAHSYI